MSTAIIISTLDEIDGVRQIMPQIKREWAETIVFVDGGSTDGTVEWDLTLFINIAKEREMR